MEYLEGETLADRLVKGPLPLEQTLRYGIEIADALDRAHRHGIVHRDLKPGNVMLTKSGVKLLDFGLAKLRRAESEADALLVSVLPTARTPLTQEGTILGTLQYMAPEQLEGREADARTDIFAFGAVLYEMATGRRAFSGASQASLIGAILHTEPPPVSAVEPSSPAVLDRIVKTCLAKDPDDRWQSAGDVGKQLRWIAESSTPGRRGARGRARAAARELGWIVAGALALVAAATAGAPSDEARTRRLPGDPRVDPPAGRDGAGEHGDLRRTGRDLAGRLAPGLHRPQGGGTEPALGALAERIRAGAPARRNRRRGAAVLVAGRALHRLLRQTLSSEDRRQRRPGLQAGAGHGGARRILESRRRHPLHAVGARADLPRLGGRRNGGAGDRARPEGHHAPLRLLPARWPALPLPGAAQPHRLRSRNGVGHPRRLARLEGIEVPGRASPPTRSTPRGTCSTCGSRRSSRRRSIPIVSP